jgi:hypothetical protein
MAIVETRFSDEIEERNNDPPRFDLFDVNGDVSLSGTISPERCRSSEG